MRISDWSSDVCSSDLNDLKLPDVWRLMRVGNEFISWRAGQPVYLKASLATLIERLAIFSTTLWAFEMGRFRSPPLFRTRLQRDKLTPFRQPASLFAQLKFRTVARPRLCQNHSPQKK